MYFSDFPFVHYKRFIGDDGACVRSSDFRGTFAKSYPAALKCEAFASNLKVCWDITTEEAVVGHLRESYEDQRESKIH